MKSPNKCEDPKLRARLWYKSLPLAALLVLGSLFALTIISPDFSTSPYKASLAEKLFGFLVAYIMCLIPTSVVAWGNASYERAYDPSISPNWVTAPRNIFEAAFALAITTMIMVPTVVMTTWLIFRFIVGPLTNSGG